MMFRNPADLGKGHSPASSRAIHTRSHLRRFSGKPWVVTWVFLTVLLCGCTAPDEPSRKPNIVLILADDLGHSELGCYGQQIIQTPHIDRIAREGIRFTQHYSGSPVCAPSRCVLMTGKHTGQSYIRDNGNPENRIRDDNAGLFPGQHPIPDRELTIAEILQGEGYATGGIGKWGLGYEGSTGDPNRQGFDLFFGYLCQIHAHNHYPRFLWRNGVRVPLDGNERTLSGQQYSQDLFVQEALRFIRANKDRPFFLYLPVTIPHLSIQVPEESLAQYRDRIPEEPYEHTAYLEHPSPRAGYAAMVSHMDQGVGQILNLIAELELEGETLVFFSSDNGPTYDRLGGSDSSYFKSAEPFRGLKGSLYEGGIRVPLVVRWPGRVPAGRVTDHISAFWDWLPTVCEIAGADIPPGLNGISFAPTLLETGPQNAHEYLYWEFPSYGGQQATRMGKWKGVRQKLFRENRELRMELYDLESDVGEQHDVAQEYPDVVSQMEHILEEARTPSDLFPFPALDGQVR